MKRILTGTIRTLTYRIGILGSIVIFLFSTSEKLVAQEHNGVQKTPSLHQTKAFLIYAKNGNFKAFDTFSGKLIKNEEVEDFRNGELLFIITGPKSGFFSANCRMLKLLEISKR